MAPAGDDANRPITGAEFSEIKRTAQETVQSAAVKGKLQQVYTQNPSYSTGAQLARDSSIAEILSELKRMNYTTLERNMSTGRGPFDPDNKVRIASDSAVEQEVCSVGEAVIQSGRGSPKHDKADVPRSDRAAPAYAGNAAAATAPQEDGDVALPKGNWVKAVGTPYYYSEDENLYYHPDSCQFYDPTNEMWYDPEKDEWYKDEEGEEDDA